jgi:hypothetical protein
MHSITLPSAAGGREMNVDVSTFSETIREALMIHGLQQKVADSVSGAKTNGWTQDECLERCQGVIASLQAGTWAKRGGGGPRASDEETFVRNAMAALIRAKDKKAGKDVPTGEELEARVTKNLENPGLAGWINATKAEYAAKRAKAGSVEID